jgi:hypothetical protein
VTIDDSDALAMSADLAKLAIVAVRNSGTNEYGEVQISKVSVCRPL